MSQEIAQSRAPSLTESLPSIVRRVNRAPHVLVLMDLDGTLAPHEPDPHDARIPQAVVEDLGRLAANPRAAAGIISGRSVADLESRVGLEGIVYAGNGGMQIRGRGLHFVEPFSYLMQPALQVAVVMLEERLNRVPGVLVENKGLTATVHTRGGNETSRALVRETVLSLMEGHGQFRVSQGNLALDILPRNGWHKGTAAQWIRRELGLDHALLVYAGDDVPDEDAFELMAGEITIKVGGGPTAASCQAESPLEIQGLLALLAEALER